eukprot:XP_011684185.1 PREDICTED: macrophage mannose receptor 1-like [Strongylocentrotus purpuratus]
MNPSNFKFLKTCVVQRFIIIECRLYLITDRTPCDTFGDCHVIHWLKYMSSCYQLVTDQKTWTDAKTDCVNKNGRLAIINNKYEQAYLASVMGAIYTYSFDYWIGLSDTDIPGTYLWVDGSYPTLSAWAPSQPDNYLGDCVALISAADGVGSNVAGLWFDERCYNEHNYICERPVEGTTDTPYTQAPVTVPSDVGCPDENAIGYGSNCFIPFERNPVEQITWDQARTYCQIMGGDLASFQTKEEEAYIVSSYTPIDPDTAKYGFWTGLNDKSREGGFQWSDGVALVYLNWDSGEPNDFDSSENCGEMYFTGRGWNDLSCSATRSFLCKVPKHIVLRNRGEFRKRTEENLHRSGGRRLILGNEGRSWDQPNSLPLPPDVAGGGRQRMERNPPLSGRDKSPEKGGSTALKGQKPETLKGWSAA